MSRLVSVTRASVDVPSISLPEHEVLEGTRDARCLFSAISRDRGAAAGLWSCEVGRYQFEFDYDEFFILLEGVLEIQQEGQPPLHMQPGDTAHFPQGITTVWIVTKPLKKYFVARAPFAEPAESAEP